MNSHTKVFFVLEKNIKEGCLILNRLFPNLNTVDLLSRLSHQFHFFNEACVKRKCGTFVGSPSYSKESHIYCSALSRVTMKKLNFIVASHRASFDDETQLHPFASIINLG